MPLLQISPRTLVVALAAAVLTATPARALAAPSHPPGGPLTTANNTPFPSSRNITGAQWTTQRYDPPPNQWGDILPTTWSSNGNSYVMIDDGGVDAPKSGGLWRQSLAQILGSPPHLRMKHVGDPYAPPPKTWREIGHDRDKDDGPLGPYYSNGFTEVQGVFYATQQRNWDYYRNKGFTGLVGIAYSQNKGETWHFVMKSFPAPLGNLTFIDSGVQGGQHPDGYVYAIGTEREFNASTLLLGRVQPGVENVTDPSKWQWYAGMVTGPLGDPQPVWLSSVSTAKPVVDWSSHITYPQMTYDKPLKRYLLTFTYSYAQAPPGIWTNGAELVILEATAPEGPYSFVARSTGFGPSNGYGAGFPSQWISSNGQDLWLKWAANFAGCARGLDCSGKYGFNVAQVHLQLRPAAAAAAGRAGSPTNRRLAAILGLAAALGIAGILAAQRWRRRAPIVTSDRSDRAPSPSPTPRQSR